MMSICLNLSTAHKAVRYLLFYCISLLTLSGCQSDTVQSDCVNSPNPKTILAYEGYNVGILVMNGVYNTELTAPMDVFEHTKYRDDINPMNVFTISNTTNAIVSSEGLVIYPDFSYFEDYPPIDILVVPSCEQSMDTDLGDEKMIGFIQEVAKDALYITSHCDGAFPLAEAGLLNGVHCTTYPADRKELQSSYPQTIVHDSVLFVHDGRYITSAGGAKSFEAALYLIEVLYGKENADEIAEGMVIDWNLDNVPHYIHKQ